MKRDIILAGVGGQGILSIAAVVGSTALRMGFQLKQAEVHGMSQRGGDVHSNLRISDREIFSDLIPYGKADLIISVEPMESLRYLPWLSKEGWLITNSVPHVNIPNYPDMELIMREIRAVRHHVALDADMIAKDLGSPRSANMVILGAAAPFLGLDYNEVITSIQTIFKNKGSEIVQQNLNALEAGRDYALNQ